MPKSLAISGKKLIQILGRCGFMVKRSSSSHFLLEHVDGRITTIPLHANRDLPKGTLKAILRDIKITNDQLQQLL